MYYPIFRWHYILWLLLGRSRVPLPVVDYSSRDQCTISVVDFATTHAYEWAASSNVYSVESIVSQWDCQAHHILSDRRYNANGEPLDIRLRSNMVDLYLFVTQ